MRASSTVQRPYATQKSWSATFMVRGLHVAPSNVARAPSNVAITEGATGYQQWPPWVLFFGLSALPVSISSDCVKIKDDSLPCRFHRKETEEFVQINSKSHSILLLSTLTLTFTTKFAWKVVNFRCFLVNQSWWSSRSFVMSDVEVQYAIWRTGTDDESSCPRDSSLMPRKNWRQ